MTNDLSIIEPDVTGFTTLQFAIGGLFDAEPTSPHIHLVRCTSHGTPGPTICGIDRFAADSPGWSVGGGVTGPTYEHVACPVCLDVAVIYPSLPVGGMFAHLFFKPECEGQEQFEFGGES